MSWARGVDANGREIGYAVGAYCDEPECSAFIDRGLAFRCGPLDNETDDSVPGCGRFFCAEHLYFSEFVSASPGGGFCSSCINRLEPVDG